MPENNFDLSSFFDLDFYVKIFFLLSDFRGIRSVNYSLSIGSIHKKKKKKFRAFDAYFTVKRILDRILITFLNSCLILTCVYFPRLRTAFLSNTRLRFSSVALFPKYFLYPVGTPEWGCGFCFLKN